eukprot:1144280-Pelagomonas_calceolata.AAC.3
MVRSHLLTETLILESFREPKNSFTPSASHGHPLADSILRELKFKVGHVPHKGEGLPTGFLSQTKVLLQDMVL